VFHWTTWAARTQIDKLIAYELGLAHSTIRVLLARAAQKLGARSRAELLERFRALRNERTP
jgi:DNA-binding CsgD family transcriptional regulator